MTQPGAPNARGLAIAVSTEPASVDPMPTVSRLAFTGLVLAAAFAAFGLPPASIHGPLHFLGVMDPLCGMTRGVTATMRGDLAAGWAYNPASPLVVAGAAASLARWVVGRATRRWLAVRVVWTPALVGLVVLLVAVLEVNQQLHAERLQ